MFWNSSHRNTQIGMTRSLFHLVFAHESKTFHPQSTLSGNIGPGAPFPDNANLGHMV